MSDYDVKPDRFLDRLFFDESGNPVTVSAARTRLTAIQVQPPALTGLPSGCRFAPRGPHAMPICRTTVPVSVGTGHNAACHLPTLETMP